jgi:vancomycin permeability regulator SanA
MKNPRKRTFPFRKLLNALFLLVGIFLIFCGCIVADGLIDNIKPADVAVILGNKVNPDGKPSSRLQSRLDKAVELYKQGLFENIAVSGGIGEEGFYEASVMKQYLVEKGIPEFSITIDNEGINTFSTAKNTVKLMNENGYQSVIVISQYFHISRTKLAFQRCGSQTVYSAHADFFEWRDLYSIPREVIGWVAYLFHSCK